MTELATFCAEECIVIAYYNCWFQHCKFNLNILQWLLFACWELALKHWKELKWQF